MEKYKRQFFLNEKLSKQQVDALLKDIKEIIIKFAEGNVEYSNRVKGKKFKTIKETDSFFNSVNKPDIGYDKHDMIIVFKNGTKLDGFRYDHGEKDPSFSQQLKWYIENRVSITEG